MVVKQRVYDFSKAHFELLGVLEVCKANGVVPTAAVLEMVRQSAIYSGGELLLDDEPLGSSGETSNHRPWIFEAKRCQTLSS